MPNRTILPHRDTDTIVRVRVAIRPVQLQLRVVGVHVTDDRVVVHSYSLVFPDSGCSQTAETSVAYTPDARGANLFAFDC